nr:hypothetical protein [Tanacetum cinerariifolium]
HASASTPSETATGSAGRSTTGSQSRQLSASESAFAEEPVQSTCQMEDPPHPMFETGADDQPIEHCHPEVSGRSSTGSGKLPEETQPYEARHISNQSKAL